MDLSGEKKTGSLDLGSSRESLRKLKSYVDCQTTKMLLSPGGPSGPKPLCNACGIRYRKEGSVGAQERGEEREEEKEREREREKKSGTKELGGVSVKLRMLGVGSEVLFKRSSLLERRKKRMGKV